MVDSAAPETRVCCAYDGSINGHWVARYAMCLAAVAPERTLRIVHARDGRLAPALLERKLEHVVAECRAAGIRPVVHEVRGRGRVGEAILEAVPAGPATLLLCGARARARGHALIAGTVSERLLRAGHCNVLALRVVAPGQLGNPHRLLLPVAGHPGEAREAAPFLHLLLAAARELHLLRVVLAEAAVIDRATQDHLARLRAHGRAAVTHAESELRAALAVGDLRIDTHVRLADEWARPTIVLAGMYRSELVLAAGTEHALGGGRLGRGPLERLLEETPCDVGIYRASR